MHVVHHRSVDGMLEEAAVNPRTTRPHLIIAAEVELHFPTAIVFEPANLLIMRKPRRLDFELRDERAALAEVRTFFADAVQRIRVSVVKLLDVALRDGVVVVCKRSSGLPSRRRGVRNNEVGKCTRHDVRL